MKKLEFLLKTKSRKRWIEYLKIFDNECGTNSIDLARDVPMLLAIYEDFAQNIIQSTESSIKAHNELVRVSDEFRNTLNREQIELLEELQDCMEEIHCDSERQAFIFGYLIMSHLKEEGLIKDRKCKHKCTRKRSKYYDK